MKTVMFIGDIHLSTVPPSSRTDNYKEAIFTKLYQCTALVQKMHIDAVVLMGDIFHLKSWRSNPYYLTNEVVVWLKSLRDAGSRVFLVVGNHDVPFGNTDLIDRQPIGVLRSLDFIETDGYLEDPRVRILVKDFNPDFKAADLQVSKGDEEFLVVCCHQCIMPKGQFFDEPTVNFAEVQTDADVIAYGHIHAPTIVHRQGSILFLNPGAISRGSIHKDNLGRDVNVVLLRFSDKVEHAVIKLDIRPSSEVFDIERHEQGKRRDEEIEEFVDMLRGSSEEVNTTDPYAVLESIETDPAVKAMARTYLDGDHIEWGD